MRRFSYVLAFIMLGLGLGLAVAAPPAAAAETMTWTMRSSYDSRVQVEFYSHERKAAWPGNGRAYPLNDSKPHVFKLNCQRGEKICYGAWPTAGGSTYWGVGAKDKHTCKTCCAVCGLDNPTKTLSD